MGFDKRIILPKHQLQQMVYDHGAEYVVRYYAKADAVYGDADSMEYLKSLKEIINKNKK
jgi:thiamine pyrophosphokinase